MSRSKRAPASFYAGPILVQPAEALDRFVRTAPADAEFVYCEAPEPQYGETWTRAGELAGAGLVRALSRRRAGGGWQWYVERTRKSLPRDATPAEKALADRATSIIFAELKRAANFQRPCPSDTDLAKKAGLTIRQQAGNRVRKLIDVGLIHSEVVYEQGVASRVVTILSTGKFTALPKKWAALRQAAERDARAPDQSNTNQIGRAAR